MTIEAVEFVAATGKLAEIVGGRQHVEIHHLPARTREAYWNNPSVNCTRGSWLVPARRFPERFVVIREDGTRTGFSTYERALDVALRAAAYNKKP